MDVDAGQLRTLAAVIDHGTFDAAAAELGISPSAVSQRMKALESEVGAVLLVRSKPLRPTPAGEVVLRMARQFALLSQETETALSQALGTVGRTVISLAANADSLATWLMPALSDAAINSGVLFTVHRVDQAFSARLLQRGEAMAAVTSDPRDIAGCTLTPLGVMRYWPRAHPDFIAEHFADGFTEEAVAWAPMLNFDANDELQYDYLSGIFGRRLRPPAHFLPEARQFHVAVAAGMGWSLVPNQFLNVVADDDGQHPRDLAFEKIPGAAHMDVTLYWHQWNLGGAALDELRASVQAAARHSLLKVPPEPDQ
ncbi:ArgP/LysG family DNA-binding transcriptional regulator [Sediminivirga luteola]|uniref:Transcriptional regulator ArgP n=1 Tax=Sediminivirga luteola TaxID=1774748 RepID=A0A8J2XI98_9MICO|nr:ArgP/LysG family DNA-binding transcriptional regulator [Sediminivirga luteola]MCI2264626.1 ArgP/LysG family DNA-binding transcriptional regulator [Sediminivirga luteola]GGA02915.1 transcriptional regulator ArgP [Sediminivirga luteola]